MKNSRGLMLDTQLNDTPAGYLTYARNILLTEKLGVIGNEPGFTLQCTIPNRTCIGTLSILNDVVVFSIATTGSAINNTLITTNSEIGIITNSISGVSTYTKICNDSDVTPGGYKFNFSYLHSVKAEYYINASQQRVIAWVDGFNTPKVINIDLPPYNATQLELFPSAGLPIPTVIVLQNAGGLLSGTYQIVYQYQNIDGSTSSWSAASKIVSIIQDPASGGSGSIDPTGNISGVWGCPPGTPTSKAIQATVTPDNTWYYINFAAIQTVNNITSIVQFQQTPIGTSSSVTAVYNGSETITTLTLQEILIPNAFYINAKTITQLNNILYLANLTAAQVITLQKFCMNVQLTWTSRLISTLSGTRAAEAEASGTLYAGFQHGEVYSFYLQFRDKKTGLWTPGFHIPGLIYNAGTWTSYEALIAPSPGGSYISGSGSPAFSTYQLEDAGVLYSGTSGGVATGIFGVWKNQNETYPNVQDYNGSTDYNGASIPGGLDYRNNFVTHHKFPSLGYIQQAVYASNPNYGISDLDVLGVQISIPPTIGGFVNNFSAYRLCYAKRDVSNAINLGSSALYYFGQGFGTGNLRPLITNGPTFANANTSNGIYLSNDTAVTGRDNSVGANFIRWHGFNTQIDMPSISPNYLRQEYRLNYNVNYDTNVTASTDGRLLTDQLNSNAPSKYLLHGPATLTGSGYNGGVQLAIQGYTQSYRFRNVSFVQYLPTGGIVSNSGYTINNVYGESCLLLQQNNLASISSATDKTLGIVGPINFVTPSQGTNSETVSNGGFHNTWVSTLCQLRTDVYLNFYNQNLVSTDIEFLIGGSSSAIIQGGDTWVGWDSIQLQGPTNDNPSTLINHPTTGFLTGEGCKAVHVMINESAKNLNYRYVNPAIIQSYFYTKNNLLKTTYSNLQSIYFAIQNLAASPQVLYNADYNILNTTGNNMVTYNPFTITTTNFPSTIIASNPNNLATTSLSWKNFLSTNLYTMPTNKGNVVNLQGVGNQKLYIHMTNGLFLTKDRVSLKTNIQDVTLGSGAIFAVSPYEVVTTNEGYAGTQNMFSCVLTKAGYVFMDVSQGKIFLHNGEQLEEISKNGTRQFWRDYLKATGSINNSTGTSQFGLLGDNPFIGSGVTITYDEQFNRLLVSSSFWNSTVSGLVPSFKTLSYSPQLESWVSWHDYNPSQFITTRNNKLFSIHNTGFFNNGTQAIEFYQHNSPTVASTNPKYGKYYLTDINGASINTTYPLLAEVVFNEEPYLSKIFRSVQFTTESTDPVTFQPYTEDTIDWVTVQSVNKSTGTTQVEQYVNSSQIYDSNTRQLQSTWSFNQLRDLTIKPIPGPLRDTFMNDYNLLGDNYINTSADWYDKARFIDKWISVRVKYDNLTNYKFLLLDIKAESTINIRS